MKVPTLGRVLVTVLVLPPVSRALTCKCIPGDPADPCWPTAEEWTALNVSVSGRLIVSTPIATPCYAGPSYDPNACATVQANWLDTSFRSQFPSGYSYSDFESCDIPSAAAPGAACGLGNSPLYAVDAVTPNDVSYAVQFARQKRLRLAIKTTGHDFLTRSTGFGSLEIWLRNLRQGITFEPVYQPSAPCLQVGAGAGVAGVYAGGALSVGGGYSWSDVYAAAKASNCIVSGSACPDVSALGGYLQGGGYSTISGIVGMAADQLLEAFVVLSDGSQVVASACQNPDLFAAIRGGGGGTYGIITSAKIKAYPEAPVVAVDLVMMPLTVNDTSLFVDVIGFIYQYGPYLADLGFGGHGGWTIDNPSNTFGGAPAVLHLSLAALGQPLAQVQSTVNGIIGALANLNGTNLHIKVNVTPFSSYSDWYFSQGNVNAPPAGGISLTSRLLSREHLKDAAAVRYMLHIAGGNPGEGTVVSFALVGGAANLAFAAQPDPLSGVNPAWRRADVLQVLGRQWPTNATAAHVADVHHDVTFVKGAAATALAPDSGSYMNEGDWQDPDYLNSFYGGALGTLQAAKAKYDPEGVFYCPTCVGSEQWVMDGAGRICKP